MGGKVVVLEKHEHIMQNSSLQAAHVGIRQSGIQTESLNETVSLSAPNQIETKAYQYNVLQQVDIAH